MMCHAHWVIGNGYPDAMPHGMLHTMYARARWRLCYAWGTHESAVQDWRCDRKMPCHKQALAMWKTRARKCDCNENVSRHILGAFAGSGLPMPMPMVLAHFPPHNRTHYRRRNGEAEMCADIIVNALRSICFRNGSIVSMNIWVYT